MDYFAQLMRAVDAIRLRIEGGSEESFRAAWLVQQKETHQLYALSKAFKLTAFECQLVTLCAGLQLTPELTSLIATHHQSQPTFQFALKLFGNAHWRSTTPEGPLRYWNIIRPTSAEHILISPLRLDERILHYLMGVPTFSASLTGLIKRVQPTVELTASQQQLADYMTSLHKAPTTQRVPHILLQGHDRTATQAVATQAYRQLGIQTIRIVGENIPTSTRERIELSRLIERETLLTPSALYIDGYQLNEPQQNALTLFADQFAGLQTIGLKGTLRGFRKDVLHLELPRPTRKEQTHVWRESLGALADSMNGSLDRIVSQFDLETDKIRILGARIRGEKALGDDTPEAIERRIWNLCGVQARPDLDTLCQRIESSAGWEDIVLPADQKQTLEEVIVHARQRNKVYYDWGFARKNNRGLGLTALFCGDSGTGKTLSAEIIANQLRLPLYRIELSALVSKYIGETEKNLSRIFDAAEAMGAVLLFDEADALFGKRSEVKDAHDRYANIEVSYLLQRMEAYRGLAILTTNLKKNLDTAFLRRLRFIVQFPFPGPAERALIWRRMFPQDTPMDDLDYTRLSQLNLAGGHIKNIALRSAFLAAHVDQPVSMTHILHAVRSEYRKLEKPLTSSEIRGWVT